MPLTWNLEKIENYRDVCFIETDQKDAEGKPLSRLHPVTDMLIMMTMAVQLGQITEKNADEFYARLKLIEKLDGPFLYRFDEDGERVDRYFKPEDIQAHIGLVCNVVNESTAKFFSTLRKNHMRPAKQAYRKATATLRCPVCGETKPVSEFPPNKKNVPDRPGPWCGKCFAHKDVPASKRSAST